MYVYKLRVETVRYTYVRMVANMNSNAYARFELRRCNSGCRNYGTDILLSSMAAPIMLPPHQVGCIELLHAVIRVKEP
jgi:hypothetical protein